MGSERPARIPSAVPESTCSFSCMVRGWRAHVELDGISRTKRSEGIVGEQMRQCVLDNVGSKAGKRLVQQRTHEKGVYVFVGDDQERITAE